MPNVDDPTSAPSDNFDCKNVQRALVVGAGHGIGLALAEALRERAPRAEIIATYRQPSRAAELLANSKIASHLLDPLDEAALAAFTERLGPLDCVINAVGVLQDETARAERSLSELSLAGFQHTFAVNAFVAPLLARALKPRLVKDRPSAFVALSAKVGSIGDNQLGGWYSYRASKTALNMFIKNIALEFARSGLRRCTVLAVHPGTTETNLSRAFLRGVKHQIWTPAQSAAHILDTIERATPAESGSFKNWNGTTLPW